MARASTSLAVLLTCVLFTASLADPVNVIKLTVLVFAGLLVLCAGAAGLLRSRVLSIRLFPTVVGLALLAAFGISALAAPTATTAVIGTYGRNSGLLAYDAAIVLFLAGLWVWNPRWAPMLALTLILSGLFTASYGLMQYAGLDTIRWNNPFNPIIASLGNPDFASGYLGICTPAAAWGALWDRWAWPWRLLSGLTAAACLLAAVLSAAFQGPLAALAGLAVLAAAWLVSRGGRLARRGLTAIGTGATLAVVALLLGAFKIGPAAFLFNRLSFTAREWYWTAALRMFRQHPLAGVGLDHYGAHYRQFRPAASAQRIGGDNYSDAAHSVPLQMLAQGGLILTVAYAAFTLLVAASLVRGFRRLAGQDLLLLGGVGGAWFAYLVQSAVSIDQVPLITAQFSTAGAVVALAELPRRQFRLTGALAPESASTGRRPRKPILRERALHAGDYVILSATLVFALWGAWLSLLPLRANAAVRAGDAAIAAGDATAALTHYQLANRLLPGLGSYWGKTAGLYESARQPAAALAAYARGAAHDPFDVNLVRNTARLALAQHKPAEAVAAARRAASLDPTNPATISEASQILRDHGDPVAAVKIIDGGLAVFPRDADLWVARGAALVSAHDGLAARRAYDMALRLNPSQPGAKQGLAALGS